MDGGYTVFCIKARGKCLSPIGFVGVKRCLLLGNVSYLTHFMLLSRCFNKIPESKQLEEEGFSLSHSSRVHHSGEATAARE